MEEFRYRLLNVIADRGITASELAKASGIDKGSISNYINGKYIPKQDKVYQLAKALGVDAGWLMTGDEPVEKELSFDERLAVAYHLADSGTQAAVRKLLDLEVRI